MTKRNEAIGKIVDMFIDAALEVPLNDGDIVDLLLAAFTRKELKGAGAYGFIQSYYDSADREQ